MKRNKFVKMRLFIFGISVLISLSSCSNGTTGNSEINSRMNKNSIGDDSNGSQDSNDKTFKLKEVTFSLDSTWKEEVATDTTWGFKQLPCSESYCNNLFVSVIEVSRYEYLDWSSLVSGYVSDLGNSTLSEISLLSDSFENSSDSTWYELRYSYKNNRGEAIISEVHMIWLPTANLYTFDFTAKDIPVGSFSNFKVNAITPVVTTISY